MGRTLEITPEIDESVLAEYVKQSTLHLDEHNLSGNIIENVEEQREFIVKLGKRFTEFFMSTTNDKQDWNQLVDILIEVTNQMTEIRSITDNQKLKLSLAISGYTIDDQVTVVCNTTIRNFDKILLGTPENECSFLPIITEDTEYVALSEIIFFFPRFIVAISKGKLAVSNVQGPTLNRQLSW